MKREVISDKNNIAMIFDDASVANTVEYWTEERLAAALPSELHVRGEAIEPLNQKVLTPEIADLKKVPFNSGGKLYYTFGKEDYVGSAEFCADSQMLLTAAHNILDENGNWAHNILFLRGNSLLEPVPIRAVAIRKEWENSGATNNLVDYGFCVATKPYPHIPYLDYIEFDTGSTLPNNVTAFGYPKNYESGDTMMYVNGSIAFEYYDGTPVYWKMPGNPFRGGSSGGAWTIAKESNSDVDGVSHCIISLNSFTNPAAPKTMFGPILSSVFTELVSYVKEYLIDKLNHDLQEDKDFPSSLDNKGDVRYFKLKNRGWFIAHIKVKWKHEAMGCVSRGEYTTKTDIRKEAEGTLDLSTLNIPDDAIVRMIGEVQAGKDNPGDELFTYKADSGKMVTYKMTRGTQNNKMYLESYR